MNTYSNNRYFPDSISYPGETIFETINELGLTPSKLATHIGLSDLQIQALLNGEAALTPEIAYELEKVSAVPAQFWLNRERHYRESVSPDLDSRK